MPQRGPGSAASEIAYSRLPLRFRSPARRRVFIANYKIPRSLELLGGLPMSAAGKIQKNKLRERFWQGRDRRMG